MTKSNLRCLRAHQSGNCKSTTVRKTDDSWDLVTQAHSVGEEESRTETWLEIRAPWRRSPWFGAKKHPMYGPVIPGPPGLERPVMAMSDSSTQRSLGLAGWMKILVADGAGGGGDITSALASRSRGHR